MTKIDDRTLAKTIERLILADLQQRLAAEASSWPTPHLYSGIHRVDAVCVACDRWIEVDLDDHIRRGHGDVPLIQLPLRCSGCGRTGQKIVVRGRRYPTLNA